MVPVLASLDAVPLFADPTAPDAVQCGAILGRRTAA